MGLSPGRLLRISMVVAGVLRFAKGRTVVEIPYAGSRAKGKFRPESKAALDKISQDFGADLSYESDGVKISVPDEAFDEAWREIQDLFKIDKSLRSTLDLKKQAQYPDDVNEAVKQPKKKQRKPESFQIEIPVSVPGLIQRLLKNKAIVDLVSGLGGKTMGGTEGVVLEFPDRGAREDILDKVAETIQSSGFLSEVLNAEEATGA
jgi:hypothetical protein